MKERRFKMFCVFCGCKLPEDSSFCPKCGKLVKAKPEGVAHEPELLPELTDFTEEPEAVFELKSDAETPEANREDEETRKEELLLTPEQEEKKNGLSSRILIFGILGLVFANMGFLAPVGLALSIVSKAFVSRYVKLYGETSGKATVGKILGKVGFGISVGITAFIVTWLSIFVLALL